MRALDRAGVAIAAILGLLAGSAAVCVAESVAIDGIEFRVAQGWSLQRVAAEPLVRYPVHADLAPDGRLFVVESSGSSAPVKQQLEERPHRLVVLEDSSGDGHFDKRTVFADALMLPQGVLWTPEGVLVATPPEIWQFRDTTGDGVADERSVWFDGKTLTGCANDLHGPFAGRDGSIYWCKGAFAEQTYSLADGSGWSTRAAHLFRRHGQTGIVESVMTGGMDNPVEFAMSLCGERFFTCTFIQHPAEGRRDALVHAIYGGVYGKDHGVLQGHPRTGPLMPVMTHLGPAAPAGLMIREATLSDENLRGDLVVAQFNLQKVSQHALVAQGAAMQTIDSDLLVADRPDFHPTDVLEDADGSLLVIDTGGWYTLCCPTSHIDQSQATGGIYRLIPPGERPKNPRGTAIGWDTLDADALVRLLGDQRPAVRGAARARLVDRPQAAGAALLAALRSYADERSGRGATTALLRAGATWCVIEIAGNLDPAADAQRGHLLSALVESLDDPEITVRLAAAQGLGMHRFAPASDRLLELLNQGDARERRHAAEALGRIGNPATAAGLLSAIGEAEQDRALEHAVLYALIQLGPDATATMTAALQDEHPPRRAAALRVLDQIPDSPLGAADVLAAFQQGSDGERDLAIDILARRPAWDAVLAERLPELLKQGGQSADDQRWRDTVQRLVLRTGLADAVGELIASGPAELRSQLLDALTTRPPTSLPGPWIKPIAERLTRPNASAEELDRWAKVLAAVQWKEAPPDALVQACATAMQQHEGDAERWLMFAAAAPPGVSWRQPAGKGDPLSPGFLRLVSSLGESSTPRHRQLALAALARQQLGGAEKQRLAEVAGELGPMELSGVLALLRGEHDQQVNAALLDSLARSTLDATVGGSVLEDHFREHPDQVRSMARPLIQRLSGDGRAKQEEHLNRVLDELPEGDPLRGFQLFRSSRAACSACHAVGYHGGQIGPDLTQVNRIRTSKDLLEAILYPSASFVRSYEPYLVMTADGRAHSGLIADEDLQSITLVTGIDQRVRIGREDIEMIRPHAVSIMPAGLEQQLTLQELADLLAFLRSER